MKFVERALDRVGVGLTGVRGTGQRVDSRSLRLQYFGLENRYDLCFELLRIGFQRLQRLDVQSHDVIIYDGNFHGQTVAPRPNLPLFFSTVVAGGLGMGLVLGLPIVDGTLSELHLRGGLAMFIGSTTGMAGTYLALLMVVLASRAPILERVLGQVGVIHWHKRLAPWPIVLISAHAVFLTLAYAEAAKSHAIVQHSRANG